MKKLNQVQKAIEETEIESLKDTYCSWFQHAAKKIKKVPA